MCDCVFPDDAKLLSSTLFWQIFRQRVKLPTTCFETVTGKNLKSKNHTLKTEVWLQLA